MPARLRVASNEAIWKKFATSLFVFGIFVRALSAQPTLGLPRIDGVTGFYRAGHVSGEKRVAPCRWSTTCGWGFEALYEIGSPMTEEETQSMLRQAESIKREGEAIKSEGDSLKAEARALGDEANTQTGTAAEKTRAEARKKNAEGDEKEILGDRKIEEASEKKKQAQALNRKWYSPRLELAVGYDFLNIDRRATNSVGSTAVNYEVLSSVQTLPSISLYGDWDVNSHREKTSSALRKRIPTFDVYVGIGTGHVVLKNAKVFDSNGGVYSISPDPDAYPFTWSAGVTCCTDPSSPKSWPMRFFIEYSHETRTFPGVGYTYINSGKGDLSATLPHTLSVSGYVINVGFEMLFPKSPHSNKP